MGSGEEERHWKSHFLKKKKIMNSDKANGRLGRVTEERSRQEMALGKRLVTQSHVELKLKS